MTARLAIKAQRSPKAAKRPFVCLKKDEARELIDGLGLGKVQEVGSYFAYSACRLF